MKIAVLVSGGVDSAVALNLLKEQGHDLTAYYLKIWLEDELAYLGQCPWDEDLAFVRAVCEQAGVPLKIITLQKEYYDRVVGYAITEIQAGRTPNPDIFCNKRVKFGSFFDHIDASYDAVATGHYAHIMHENGIFKLATAPDTIKDQTYFLSGLSQEQLSRIVFPLGKLTKKEVRQLAQAYNLANKDRKDSQGICFLGKIKFRDFIKHNVGTQAGVIIELETGATLGEHEGFWFYTIGQRSGLGLAGGPWYVVSKDPQKNIVFISRNYYTDEKLRDTVPIAQFNPTAGMNLQEIAQLSDLKVKLRHGPHMVDCAIASCDADCAIIKLSEHDQGIAPGQFAVLYSGNICLGGGVIE